MRQTWLPSSLRLDLIETRFVDFTFWSCCKWKFIGTAIESKPQKYLPMENHSFGKMRPLSTAHLMMTWLSMCSATESTTFLQKFGHIAHTLIVLFLNLSCSIASLVYIFKYFSTDFDGAAFAFMATIGEIGLIYFLFAAILMRQQIDGIFTSLSSIYSSSKCNHKFWKSKTVLSIKSSTNSQIRTRRPFNTWLVPTKQANGCGPFTSSILQFQLLI